MPGQGKLTTLLTQRLEDPRKIIEFARSKKLEAADLFALKTAYLSLQDEYGLLNIFHVACRHNKPEIVSALIKEGWKIHTHDKIIGSPLEIALVNGNLSVAHLLIEMGVDVKSMSPCGYTPMLSAIVKREHQKTSVSSVKLLLEAGVSVNAVVDRESRKKALHVAVCNNAPKVVSFLLQMGADGNALDVDQYTALHIAVQNSCLEIIRLLTLHKVDFYIRNINGETPMLVGLNRHQLEAIETLVKGGCDVNRAILSGSEFSSYTPLHFAVERFETDLVKLLVRLGADPNKRGAKGRTAVHCVCLKNINKEITKSKYLKQASLAILELLVENGGNVNLIDNEMITPLRIAIQNGFMKLAKLLVKVGAEVNVPMIGPQVLFHWVVTLNRDIIELFLEFGADYNAENRSQLTPYQVAIVEKVDVKFIKSFVKSGCPYNQGLSVWSSIARKCDWGTEKFIQAEKQFFFAIKENNLELLKSAVENGAVPTGCSEEMKFPLHYVTFNGYEDIMVFLLKHNFPPNTVNQLGQTPLILAAEQGNFNISKILLKFGACYNYRSKVHPKTPVMVADELQHKTTVLLLKGFQKIFQLTRLQPRRAVAFLEKVINRDLDTYKMFANATNIKGDTLIASCLRYNHIKFAMMMMKLRLGNGI